MKATLYWHWWGWGQCDIQPEQAPAWQIGKHFFERQLPIYSSSFQGLRPRGQVIPRAFKHRYRLELDNEQYELKTELMRLQRFSLNHQQQTLLHIKQHPSSLQIYRPDNQLIGTAIPDTLTGYAAVWHAEIDHPIEQALPLELLCLALILREQHWTHNTIPH